jgi:hypothetical protein
MSAGEAGRARRLWRRHQAHQARPGPVGAAGIVRLGAARERLGRAEGAVSLREFVVHQPVEPNSGPPAGRRERAPTRRRSPVARPGPPLPPARRRRPGRTGQPRCPRCWGARRCPVRRASRPRRSSRAPMRASMLSRKRPVPLHRPAWVPPGRGPGAARPAMSRLSARAARLPLVIATSMPDAALAGPSCAARTAYAAVRSRRSAGWSKGRPLVVMHLETVLAP